MPIHVGATRRLVQAGTHLVFHLALDCGYPVCSVQDIEVAHPFRIQDRVIQFIATTVDWRSLLFLLLGKEETNLMDEGLTSLVDFDARGHVITNPWNYDVGVQLGLRVVASIEFGACLFELSLPIAIRKVTQASLLVEGIDRSLKSGVSIEEFLPGVIVRWLLACEPCHVRAILEVHIQSCDRPGLFWESWAARSVGDHLHVIREPLPLCLVDDVRGIDLPLQPVQFRLLVAGTLVELPQVARRCLARLDDSIALRNSFRCLIQLELIRFMGGIHRLVH